MRRVRLVTLIVVAACGHDAPYRWAGPDPRGPASDALPRRLTFNAGDDRNPSVTGGMLVFSRLPLDGRYPRERCLAFLPAAGGVLQRTACPPIPASPADTFVDTWVEPALSADGEQIAYVWQRGATVSVFTWTRDLVIAPVNALGRPTYTWQTWYNLPDGRIATTVSKPIWLSSMRLRFLAAYERVFKVKGGGATRLTDTVIDVFSLLDLDLTTGQVGVVPGADSTIAYAPALNDGDYWLVKSSDSTRLLLLASGADHATPVGSFSGAVVDLANVNGVAVALRSGGSGGSAGSGGSRVEWIDPVSGAAGGLDWDTPINRIAAVPGTRQFIAEVEKTAVPLAQDGANLWLFAIP